MYQSTICESWYRYYSTFMYVYIIEMCRVFGLVRSVLVQILIVRMPIFSY